MYKRLILKLILHHNGSSKRVLLYSKKELFSFPLKINPFIRSVSTLPQTFSTENSGGGKLKAYFKNYFLTQPRYKSLLLDENDLNLETEGKPEFVRLLKDLDTKPVDEEFIEKLRLTLLKDKESLDFEDICKSLYLTFQYNSSNENSTVMKEVGDILEQELHNRKLSKSQIIKAMLSLYETWGRQKTFFFQKKMKRRLLAKSHQLSLEQAVVIFHMNLGMSDEDIQVTRYKIKEYISNNISSFNGTELGIIAKSLVWNQLSCGTELLISFMNRTAELIESTDELPLYFIFKLLKANIGHRAGQHLLDFQEKFIPYISKYSTDFWSQLLVTGSSIGCFNISLWEKVASAFKENINDLSLPTLERVVSFLTNFDIQDEELLKLAVERLENVVDLDKKKYISSILLLNHLVHLRKYPKKLIDLMYGEDYSHIANGCIFIHKSCAYYETLCCLEMDYPEFKCKSLTEKDRSYLCRMYHFHVAHTFAQNASSAVLRTMYEVLKTLYEGNDEGTVVKAQWHPFERMGAIMRFDQNLKATPIPVCVETRSFLPPKALNDDHIWVYLYLVPKYLTFFGSEKFKPRIHTFERYLKELGYNVIMVKESELREKKSEVNEFLPNLIKSHLLKIVQDKNQELKSVSKC